MSAQHITKREAAAILSVDPSTVHRLMQRGELQSVSNVVSDSRTIMHMFRRSDVEQLAKKRAAA